MKVVCIYRIVFKLSVVDLYEMTYAEQAAFFWTEAIDKLIKTAIVDFGMVSFNSEI